MASEKMKKTKRIISVLTIMFVLASQSLVYGAVIPKSNNVVVMDGTMRGELISSLEVSLNDEGKGRMGVYASVLCHQEMKEIRLNLYLDKWDEPSQAWEQQKSYSYIWDESNTSQEDRYMGAVDFVVSGLARGNSYRLRAMAGATALDGTRSRIWRAETDAVQAQSIE